MDVMVVVKGGMVRQVFSTSSDVSVEVLDLELRREGKSYTSARSSLPRRSSSTSTPKRSRSRRWSSLPTGFRYGR